MEIEQGRSAFLFSGRLSPLIYRKPVNTFSGLSVETTNAAVEITLELPGSKGSPEAISKYTDSTFLEITI